MQPYTHDTSPEAHRRHIANIRAMTPAQRVAAAFDLSAYALEQALVVIRRRQPLLSPMEARLLLLERLYGPELVARVRQSIQAAAHE